MEKLGFDMRLDVAGERLLMLLRRPWVLALVTILLTASALLGVRRADPDLFARVAMGRLVVQQGQVPHVDPFGFTPRKAQWVDHEWLAGVVYYLVADAAGDLGLVLCSLAFIAGTWALLTAAALQFSGATAGTLVLLWLAALDARYLYASVVRAQVFTYLGLALTLWVLVQVQRSRSRWPLVLLPCAMVPWANAHGGFVVGLGLLGVFAFGLLLERQWRSGVLVLATMTAALLATLVNPYGLAYWEFILEATSMERPTITEWAAPGFLSIEALPLHLVSALLLPGLILHPRRIGIPALLVLAVTAVEAYQHIRFSALYLCSAAVFGGPLVDALLSRIPSRGVLRRAGRVAAATALSIALWFGGALAGQLMSGAPRLLDYRGYPEQALSWLRANMPRGNLLVDFNNGSFALWRLYPHSRISLDGRYEEVYPTETVTLVTRALVPSSRHHQAALQSVNPDYILVEAPQGEAFGAEWLEIYRDGRWVLLSRTPGPEGPVASPPMVPMWQPQF